MKNSALRVLYVLPFLFLSYEALALPMGYEQLQVTKATDAFTGLFNPTINNSGEIVYERVFFTSSQLVSTRRGAISVDLGGNLGPPDMNNLGEVVYTATRPPLGGLRVYSRERGALGFGVGPHINDLGYVVADSGGPGDELTGIYPLALYSPDHTWAPFLLDESLPEVGWIVNLSNSGELFYVSNTFGETRQLYSSVRGQLTTLASGIDFATANNLGEFSYGVYDSDRATSSLF